MTDGWSRPGRVGRESCNDRERVPRRTEDDDAKSATLTTEQTDVARERERGGEWRDRQVGGAALGGGRWLGRRGHQ